MPTYRNRGTLYRRSFLLFDIYLPVWLAEWNKVIFGSLFGLNCLIVLGEWLIAARHSGPR